MNGGLPGRSPTPHTPTSRLRQKSPRLGPLSLPPLRFPAHSPRLQLRPVLALALHRGPASSGQHALRVPSSPITIAAAAPPCVLQRSAPCRSQHPGERANRFIIPSAWQRCAFSRTARKTCLDCHTFILQGVTEGAKILDNQACAEGGEVAMGWSPHLSASPQQQHQNSGKP